jgi:hypothetical protein
MVLTAKHVRKQFRESRTAIRNWICSLHKCTLLAGAFTTSIHNNYGRHKNLDVQTSKAICEANNGAGRGRNLMAFPAKPRYIMEISCARLSRRVNKQFFTRDAVFFRTFNYANRRRCGKDSQ